MDDETRREVIGEVAGVLRRLQEMGIEWLPFAAPRLQVPGPPPASPPLRQDAGSPSPPPAHRRGIAGGAGAEIAGREGKGAAASGGRTAPAAGDVQALEREIAGCRRCSLAGDRPPVVGEGDPGSDILFVAGWPGEEAAAAGKVWLGGERELFARMLAAVKLDIAAVYSTFAVKCVPPAAGPAAGDARACLACLERQVAVLQPWILVAVGADAARLLTGSQQSVFHLRRGRHRFAGRPVHVLHHPAFLLQHQETVAFRRQAWEDLKRIRSALDRARGRQGA